MTKQLPKWAWAIVSFLLLLIIGFADSVTDFELNFYVFYFLPIALAAWRIGEVAGVTFAILATIAWYCSDVLSGHVFSSHFYAIWDTSFHIISFLIIGKTVFSVRSSLELANTTAANLKRALSEIKVLEGFLPICMQCKKIRNESGSWERLETYIGNHSTAQFSHGYCPECGKQVMKEAGLIDNSSSPTQKE